MTYRVSDAASLLADVRETSRKALQARLLARVPQDIRSQLLAAVTQHVRGLNETQIAMQHILLDHQEP
jgi:hypothetical protein